MPAAQTRSPGGSPRPMAETPSRTEARNLTAAKIPPRYTPIRMPLRSTSSWWTSTRRSWPASAAMAATAMPRWAEKSASISIHSDHRLVRYAGPGAIAAGPGIQAFVLPMPLPDALDVGQVRRTSISGGDDHVDAAHSVAYPAADPDATARGPSVVCGTAWPRIRV